MKRKVLHFVRKSSQLKASFINNQVNSHIDFEPCVVFRKNVDKENDGGFADFDLNKYPYLDLSENETLEEKLRFKTNKTLSCRQIRLILSFIKKYNIDICHFHYGTDCGVFYPILKKMNVPSVVSFYGYDCSSFPSFMFGYGGRFLIHRVFKDAIAVLAMSPDMKNDLLKSGCPEEKIIVHYHGTDMKRFYHQHDYTKKSLITILILASLVPQKGHLFLLKSIKKLVQKGIVNFSLHIVGTGELEQELKSFVHKHKLDENVIFFGAIKYGSTEMLKEYHSADIFAHPSVIAPNGDKEGIPGTIAEAMSSGIPVISTYHAGVPYIIEDHKTGFLVNENNTSDLAYRIIDLISKIELREKIGRNGQKYALDNLDLSKKEMELEDIYSQLIGIT